MDYNLNLIVQGILTVTQMLFDVCIVWFLIYYAIRIIRNNSRTIQIFKGVVVVLIVDTLAKFLGLSTVAYISSLFVSWGFLIIVIIFQPEIRGMLEKLGKSNTFSTTSNLSLGEKEKFIDDLVRACETLSKNRTGALISIEQNQSLNDYINTGVSLNSLLSYELLTSIFITTTPLHDGAVIIKGNKVSCASAFFPPTNLSLSAKFGARHRAAIGISEISDCITIVCSEETGEISIAHNGNLQLCNENNLKDNLMRLLYNYDIEIEKSKKDTNNNLFILENNTIEIEDKEKLEKKSKKSKSQTSDGEKKSEKKSIYNMFSIKRKDGKDVKPVVLEEKKSNTEKDDILKNNVLSKIKKEVREVEPVVLEEKKTIAKKDDISKNNILSKIIKEVKKVEPVVLEEKKTITEKDDIPKAKTKSIKATKRKEVVKKDDNSSTDATKKIAKKEDNPSNYITKKVTKKVDTPTDDVIKENISKTTVVKKKRTKKTVDDIPENKELVEKKGETSEYKGGVDNEQQN